jgi:gas vesicle protein
MTAAIQAMAAKPRRGLPALRRPAEIRHAARVAAAVGASFAIGAIFHLPQGYWIVFTAIIVVQTSVGGTITASIERLLGTVVGGLIGVAAAYLRAKTTIEEGLVISAAAAIAAFAAAVRPSLRVAPITAAIVLLGGASAHLGPITAAAWRVAEIGIGGVVGVLATLLIFPARARRVVRQRAAGTLRQLADLATLFATRFDAGGVDQEARPSHDAIRKSLVQVDQALSEAERETLWGRRADGPEGLARSVRRLSSDSIMIGRALTRSLPRASGERIGPPAVALLEAVSIRLRNSAGALETFKATPPDGLDQARAVFEAAVQQTRAARLTAEINFDAASRVFGLVFAMESLLANLSDLSDRIAELAGQAAPSAAAGLGEAEAVEP